MSSGGGSDATGMAGKPPEASAQQSEGAAAAGAASAAALSKAERKALWAKNNPMGAEKSKNPGSGKKQMTKAERRALQEKQRAAKAAKKGGGAAPSSAAKKDGAGAGAGAGASASVGKGKAAAKESVDSAGAGAKDGGGGGKGGGSEGGGNGGDGVSSFFSHLQGTGNSSRGGKFNSLHCSILNVRDSDDENAKLHPAVVELGFKYGRYQVVGSNSRAREMLRVFKVVMKHHWDLHVNGADAGKQQKADFYRVISNVFSQSFTYLTKCRQHAISMGNAYQWLKREVLVMFHKKYHGEGGDIMLEVEERIDAWIEQKTILSRQVIGKLFAEKVKWKTVSVLTLGYSSCVFEAVKEILERNSAVSEKFEFHLIIAASRHPLCTAMKMLTDVKNLLKTMPAARDLLKVTYIGMNSLSYIMKNVNYVLLGCSSILSNGSILSRVGTLGVAIVAESFRVPVIVMCEVYKLCKKVQLDSITYNELYSSNNSGSEGDNEAANTNRLDICYDLTPEKYVSAVITEVGMLPTSSVAVLLREME